MTYKCFSIDHSPRGARVATCTCLKWRWGWVRFCVFSPSDTVQTSLNNNSTSMQRCSAPVQSCISVFSSTFDDGPMPSRYLRKKPLVPLESIGRAIQQLDQLGPTANLSEVAREHSVNRSTLRDRYSAHSKGLTVRDRPGAPTLLASPFESRLAHWTRESNNARLCPTVACFQYKAKNLAALEGKQFNGDSGGLPSDAWCRDFCKRHHLSLRKPAPVSIAKLAAAADLPLILEFYEDWEAAVRRPFDDKTGATYLQHPERIFNCDETGYQRQHKHVRGMAEKGTKQAVRLGEPDNKESVTVLAFGSATGDARPSHGSMTMCGYSLLASGKIDLQQRRSCRCRDVA